MRLTYVFFFFFKQKTAYEMSLRDWSSDVCSSDLRPEDLEHIARRDPFGTTAIDEEDLLEVGQVVQVTRGHDVTLKTLLDRRGAGQPRILERLERHRKVPVVNPAELHDHVRQHLPALQLRDAGHAQRHHDAAPALDVPI